MIEVESLLNSRPLTYTSTDEIVEPTCVCITPSHLLCGRRIWAFPDVQVEDKNEYSPNVEIEADKLTRRMKHLAQTLKIFLDSMED